MEEIFKIRMCIEIWRMMSKSTQSKTYVLRLTKNYKVYILGDLHPLTGKSGLDDLSGMTYKAFLPLPTHQTSLKSEKLFVDRQI